MHLKCIISIVAIFSLKDSIFTSEMGKFENSHFTKVKLQFVRCLCVLDKRQCLSGE